jgi:tetratricopeptide (TPR) repeat protein
LLDELGKKDEAEEHYKKAIESDPNHAAAHSNYANLLRERRKFYDAEKEIRIAFQIAQVDLSNQYVLPYAHSILGNIFADEDYHEDAVKEYKKSLNFLNESSSKDISFISEIHNNLGWAYIQLKKSKKARDEFRNACAFDSMNVKAIRNLRALDKVGSESGVSRIQIYLSIMLLLSLIVLYYLFYIEKLSETMFVTQSAFFTALMICVLLYKELSKVKIGAIEFEKSTEFRHMESKSRAMEEYQR